MIFKTINSSVDNNRKTLSLFNKDWNTYKTNWQQGFSQNGISGGIKSIFQSNNSVISKDQLQILRNWNNAVAHGCTKQETFNRIIKDADSNTKLYFSGLNKGKGSVEGLKNAQNVAKQSTIGLTIAQTALNAAISLGITAAIMLAIKGFDKLANSAKRASEAADEAFSDTTEKVQKNEEEAKSLDELISKYKELKTSENLDVDGRKEIKEIKNDIADLVGVQASNLDLVNGKFDDEISKLDEISEKETKNAYETATANYNNSKKASEKATGDDSFLFFDGIAYTGKREKKAEKILQNAGFNNLQASGFFGNTLFVRDEFDDDYNELKGAQEKADYLQSMIDVLEQNGQRATDLYAGLISQRDKYLQYIDNQQDAANSLVNSWISYSQFSNDELSKINVDSLDSFEEYRQKMIEEAKNDESIGKMLADGTLSDEDLENAVNDFMATSTKFSTWYEQWIENIESDVQHETPISFTDRLAKVQALSDGLDQLDKIYTDVLDGGDFDYSSILGNKDFTNTFSTYTAEYENFIKTISNSPTDINACQQAFNDLATAYIYNSNALKDVTDETKESTIAMLEQMGVQNAAIIVEQSLAANKILAKLDTIDFTNATKEEILALVEEENKVYNTNFSLSQLLAIKSNLNSLKIDTASDIEQLIALANAAGAAYMRIQQLENLKDVMTNNGVSTREKDLNLNRGGQMTVDEKRAQDTYNKLQDGYNKTLISRKEELVKSYEDSISAAQDEKYAIIDLYTQGYEALKNRISDLISEYEKLMDAEKNAYDWQNTISEKTKQIADLRKQLIAYSGDVSEETRSKIQSLNVSLKDAEKDLRESEYDKLISDTKDMLSDLQDNFDDVIQDVIDSLSENFKELLDGISKTSNSAVATIKGEMNGIGYTPTDEFKEILNGTNVVTTTQNLIDTIKDFQTKMTEYANLLANSTSTTTGGQSVKDKIRSDGENTLSKAISDSNSKLSYFKGLKNNAKISRDEAKANRDSLKKQYEDYIKTHSKNSTKAKELKSKYNIANSKYNELNKSYNVQNDIYKNMKKQNNALNYLKSHLNTTDSSRDKLSDLNKALYDKYGQRVLSETEMKELAEIVGVKFDNKNKTGNLYKKLKDLGIPGFKVGSRNIPKDMIALLGEAGNELHFSKEQGVLREVGQGDKVFTNEQAQNLWKLSQLTPVDWSKNLKLNSLNIPQADRTTTTIVEVGDIVMQGVNDVETFGKQLREEICKGGKTTKCITEAISSTQLGKGIGKAKLYK